MSVWRAEVVGGEGGGHRGGPAELAKPPLPARMTAWLGLTSSARAGGASGLARTARPPLWAALRLATGVGLSFFLSFLQEYQNSLLPPPLEPVAGPRSLTAHFVAEPVLPGGPVPPSPPLAPQPQHTTLALPALAPLSPAAPPPLEGSPGGSPGAEVVELQLAMQARLQWLPP